jgi:hypothetical protein
MADVPSGPSLDSTPHYANLKKQPLVHSFGILDDADVDIYLWKKISYCRKDNPKHV